MRPAPSADERAYIAAVNTECDLRVASDTLVQALARRADAGEIVQHVRERIAIEIAILEFEARRQREGGRDSAMTHGRIIDALGKLAALEITRAKLGIESFNPKNPKVQRVVELLVQTIEAVCVGILSDEATGQAMAAFREQLTGWEVGAFE